MHTFLRDLTLLAAVTAAGGWVLARAFTPGGPTSVGSWAPTIDSRTSAAAATEDCARRAALLPPDAPARFEFQVDHPAKFLGTRGRPRLTATVAPGQRALVQFVVDIGGSVVPSSLRLLHVAGDYAAAAVAIRTAMRGWRYSPAIVDGCPVPQLVQTIVEP
jgi:hypothetical protein